MKKITLFLFLLCLSFSLSAQVLNQSAAWPNTNWTVTGSYNTDPAAFESDPTLTSNFAFDDNLAGIASDDDIAAESPVIDLSTVFAAGETWLFVDVDYTFQEFSTELLALEYWDADASAWVFWGEFAETAGAPFVNFCGGTRESFTSNQLNIAGFTSTQLAGFRYRIDFQDDDAGGQGWEYGFCFDSPVITSATPPTCPDPNSLSVANVLETSVDLVWIENGTSTTWNIEWGTSGYTIGSGTALNGVSTNPYNLTGLTAGTSYDFYVQADCGGAGTSNLVGPFNFITATPGGTCANAFAMTVEADCSSASPITFDFANAEDLEANNETASCDGFGDFGYWVSFTAPAVGSVIFNFDGAAEDIGLEVLDACGGTTIGTCENNTFDAGDNSGIIGGLTPGNTYVAVIWRDGQSGTADVCIEEGPTCPFPIDLTATTTENSADLGWTENGTATAWNLEWGPAGFTQGTGTIINSLATNTYNLTGLTDGTSYDFYVQADCGSGTSDFTGPFNFVTAVSGGDTCATAYAMNVEADCSTATPISFSFANAADIDANGENPSCDAFGNFGYWLSFTAPTVGSVVFYFDGGAEDIGLEVLDACGGTTIGTCENNTFNAGDNSGIVGGLTPGNTYVAVIWRDGQNGTADICIEEGPTCPFPSNLTATTITGNTANLGWTENGTATAWNLEWGPTGFTQGTGTLVNGTTTNPYNLTGLTTTTAYDFYVQAICTGETSNYSGPFTFTTTELSNFIVDCNAGALTEDYCYDNDGDDAPFILTYTSTNGLPLNLNFNFGFTEIGFDQLVVLDSDGMPFPGFAITDDITGDISGLSFQSTGDTIAFFINSDGSQSCGDGDPEEAAGINYTVSCATCINPQATYTIVDDCANGEDRFFVDVDITSLGDATSLTISNNIDANTTAVNATAIYQVGPFDFNIDVVISVTNDQDGSCVINSNALRVLACPPDNDEPCDATVAFVNDDFICVQSTPGSLIEATDSGVTAGSCGGDPNDDVWFQFIAQDEFQLISLANFTAFDIDHALYSGTCDALVELDCKSTEYSTVTPSLTIGDTYFVRVFSGGSAPVTTTFDLCITPYVAPVNVACTLAQNYCSGSASDVLYTPNTIGVPNTTDVACLGSIPNPTYSLLEIGSDGDILIDIVQNTAFDANDNPIGDELDVDFVIWGPFDSSEDFCALNLEVDCPTCPFDNADNPSFYPFGNIVDCSYSGDSIENLTITDATQGDIYLLLVTNYLFDPLSAQNGGVIQVTQTNLDPGNPDAGTVTADIEAEIVSNEVDIDSTNDPTEIDEVSVCGFESVTIEADSPFADEFIWYKDGIVMTGETSSTLIVTESNNYQVQAFDDQCGSDALSQLVIINLYEQPSPFNDQNFTVCDGTEADGTEAFDLDAFATSLGFGAEFTVSYYTNFADFEQAMNAVTSPYNSSGETLIMRVEDINAAMNGDLGCFQTANLELLVNPRPVISQPVDFIVCDDIDGTVDGITEFNLISINDEISTDADVTITYHTSQDGADNGTDALTSPYSSEGETIYVRAESITTGCYETTTFNTEVNIVPLATFDPIYDYEVCPNATVPVDIGLIPTNFSTDQVSIQWFIDDVLIPGQSGLILSSVLVQGDYRAEITFNDSGCVNSAIATPVIELESCIIPGGISPNGDGYNESFDLSSYGVSKLEIFNRNGRLVYSKTNYTNEWVGQTDSGDELPVGTYFYTMIYDGGKKRSDWIYINK